MIIIPPSSPMHKKIVKNISDIIYYDDWLDSWRDFVQDWKDRLKRIDTLLHKIKTSWLVEKYIKLTWNHSMILYKKKKQDIIQYKKWKK